MQNLERFTNFINRLLMWVAGCILGAMILLTCGNICLRLFWMPVKGTFELMGYCGAVIMAFALGMTQIQRGHIAVDVLFLRFSKRTQRILTGLSDFVCTAFFAIVSWQVAKYATILLKTGEVTETLRIIYYPFTYGVALGCATLALAFLTDLLKTLVQKEESNK
jgi:TRAP-type C4-dicarboxylate transport system permease small subunit